MRSQSTQLISFVRTLIAAALLLISTGALVLAAPSGTAVHFPEIEGVTLDHAAQLLPRDFKGRLNLVLLAFRREQQPEIDSWLPELRQLALARPGFDYYELPVIGPKIAPLRWVIRKGMGAKITEPGKRQRTILIFAAKAPLLGPLSIDSEETTVVLLLDAKGRLLWRSTGPWDEGKGESLRQAVEALQPARRR
ncbi:hypothetical protein [Trichloromonas sp.]|uniref:hypothetical protein n=1 Tax=Trichloromonas sp. TaxID=3069249 RepID=UPI003D818F3E